MTVRYDFDTLIERRDTDSAKWSKYPADVLPMWVADMDFAVAPEIVAAIKDRLAHPVLGYGVARQQLREQIVGDMASKYAWTIAPDDIVFLPGVEPGFNMALRSMLAGGDGVLVQTPIYQPILSAPGHWGLNRIDVELRLDESGRYRVDLDAFAAALTSASAFLLCNPHNPTGKVYDRDELCAVANLCVAEDRLIIADEIHCELLFDGRIHIPIASLGTDIAARTITLMAASKAFNISGLKTAFAIIQNKAIREKFNASRLGMVDSVNVLGLAATLAAYRRASAWKDAAVAYLEANRNYLAAAIESRLPGVRMVMPEGTFLAWLDCSALGLPSNPQAFFLEQAKVGFSAGSEFGSPFVNYLRLNFGCCRATLEDSIERLQAAWHCQSKLA